MKTNRGITTAMAKGAFPLGLLALAMVLVSCGGAAKIGPRQLTAINVQPGSGQAIAPDGTIPFSATGTFDQAPTTQANIAVQWTSSDASIAAVDPNTGIATCVMVGGPVTVSASAAGSGGVVHGSGTLACQLSPDPVVKLDPKTLGFQCISQWPVCSCTPPQTVTLTNVGGATLGIDSITISSKGSGGFFQHNTCGTSVDAGQSCAMIVSFDPRPNEGVLGEVKVVDNAVDNPQFVSLGGSATCVP